MVNIENCHTYLLQFLRYAWNFLGQTYDFSLYTGGRRCMNSRLFCGMSPKLGARSSNYTCDDVGFQILKPPRLVCPSACIFFGRPSWMIPTHQKLRFSWSHVSVSFVVSFLAMFNNWLVVWNMAFIFPNSWDDDLRSTMWDFWAAETTATFWGADWG